MIKMRFDLFSDEQLAQIHEASLDILQNIGVGNKSERLREVLLSSGCKERGNRIFFSQDVVEKGLKTVPREFQLFGRRPDYVLDIGKRRSYCQTLIGAPDVVDLETDKKRDCLLRDLADITRLADALEYVHIISPIFPRDVPQEIILTVETATMLRNTSKPLSICVESAREMKYVVELLAAVAGGKKALEKRPLATLPISTISPLEFGLHPAEALIEIVEAGIPLGLEPAPQAGATGPVTITGLVAMQNAEILAGVVAAQFVKPGAPLTSSHRAGFMDMRTGQGLWQMPEYGLTAAAMNQMARYYGIPVTAGAYTCESKTTDAHASMEHMYNALLPALIGSDILAAAGAVDSVTMSCYKMLVIDNEISGVVQKTINGLTVNEDTLAVNVIAEVINENSDFLGHKHTRKHLRAGEFWIPSLIKRQTYEQWSEKSERVEEIAKNRARDILATHKVLPLSPELDKELDIIIAAAKKDLK
jgi:trimethylamine---corrinoid protein Co-methyltransferase